MSISETNRWCGGLSRFALLAMALTWTSACGETPETGTATGKSVDRTQSTEEEPLMTEEDFRQQRQHMVQRQLVARDIVDQRVLDAMRRVPRHKFVSPQFRRVAYSDSALPIDHQQTISQPYIVALMTQLVRPSPQAKALDIGTGSGYQAAVLAELVGDVYSIEIIEPLAKSAQTRLEKLGYKNIHVRHGDGYRGWPEQAPFDVIIVAAAPDHVPPALVEQLKPGGRLVIPIGKYFQSLLLVEKAADGTVSQRNVAPVAFVPMTGEAENPREENLQHAETPD